MSWKTSLKNFFISPSILSMTGGVVLTGCYVAYKDYSRINKMLSTFSKGNVLPPLAENMFEIAYLPRPIEEEKLSNIFVPVFSNEYYLISGDVGVGKTRMIIEMVREMIETKGKYKQGAPIYVAADQGKTFPESLAHAVNFHFDEHINFSTFVDIIFKIESFPKKDDNSKLMRVLEAIEEAAFKYMLTKQRPVVLIIDNLPLLNRQMPSALQHLQDKAKLWADCNIVKVVFVNNDEEIEQKLQQNSASWSRVAPPVVISDLSRTESINFLMSPRIWENDVIINSLEEIKVTKPSSLFPKLKISLPSRFVNNIHPLSAEESERIVDLVGGRILDLMTFKSQHSKGVPLKFIELKIKEREREKFINVSRSPVLWRVISMLRNSPDKCMPLSKIIKFTSQEHVNDLCKLNIFRYIRNDLGVLVKFDSILTENVVDEMELAYLKEKEVAKQLLIDSKSTDAH